MLSWDMCMHVVMEHVVMEHVVMEQVHVVMGHVHFAMEHVHWPSQAFNPADEDRVRARHRAGRDHLVRIRTTQLASPHCMREIDSKHGASIQGSLLFQAFHRKVMDTGVVPEALTISADNTPKD